MVWVAAQSSWSSWLLVKLFFFQGRSFPQQADKLSIAIICDHLCMPRDPRVLCHTRKFSNIHRSESLNPSEWSCSGLDETKPSPSGNPAGYSWILNQIVVANRTKAIQKLFWPIHTCFNQCVAVSLHLQLVVPRNRSCTLWQVLTMPLIPGATKSEVSLRLKLMCRGCLYMFVLDVLVTKSKPMAASLCNFGLGMFGVPSGPWSVDWMWREVNGCKWYIVRLILVADSQNAKKKTDESLPWNKP
jgi:hypothetical protein